MTLNNFHKKVSDLCSALGGEHHIDPDMDVMLPQAHDFIWGFDTEEGYSTSGAFIVAFWDDHVTCSIQRDEDDFATVEQRTKFLLDALSGRDTKGNISVFDNDPDYEKKIREALNVTMRSFSH